jgi:hypothetical protein
MSAPKLEGLTDDQVRALWEANGSRAHDQRGPRLVQLGKDVSGWVMHPDDVVGCMSRLPEFRPKRQRRTKP